MTTCNSIILSDVRFSGAPNQKVSTANLDLWLHEAMKSIKDITARLVNVETENVALKSEVEIKIK